MSPGLFVEELAEILGLPAKSIVVIDRALSEAGLRSRGGRGPSAAKVTTADSATLLLAVMATPVLARADEAIKEWQRVKLFGFAKHFSAPFSEMLGAPAPVPLLLFLQRLIEMPPQDYGRSTFVLDVSVDQKIAMFHVRKGGRKAFDIGFAQYVDEKAGESRPPPPPGDMTRHTKVTHETFQKLHRLFLPAPGGEVVPEPAGRQG